MDRHPRDMQLLIAGSLASSLKAGLSLSPFRKWNDGSSTRNLVFISFQKSWKITTLAMGSCLSRLTGHIQISHVCVAVSNSWIGQILRPNLVLFETVRDSVTDKSTKSCTWNINPQNSNLYLITHQSTRSLSAGFSLPHHSQRGPAATSPPTFPSDVSMLTNDFGTRKSKQFSKRLPSIQSLPTIKQCWNSMK